MRMDLKIPRHGFCVEQNKLVFHEAIFQNSVHNVRNKTFFEDNFHRFFVVQTTLLHIETSYEATIHNLPHDCIATTP